MMLRTPPRLGAWWVLASLFLGCADDRTPAEPTTRSWKKDAANPVLRPGAAGAWDAHGVSTPCVRRVGDDLWMWYGGRDASATRIGLATSRDGITWEKHASNPVLSPGAAGAWDAQSVSDPCVLFDGVRYTMYYAGVGNGTSRIGIATSTDGVQWARAPENPVLVPSPVGTAWDDESVDAPWVVETNGRYEMWYGGRGDLVAVGYAASNDGFEWSRLLLPVLHPQVLEAITFAPCVIRESSNLRMWYAGLHESPGGGVFPGVIDAAQSRDGVEWSAHRTILSPGDPGAWDSYGLRSARVVDVAGTLTLWYEGESDPNGAGQGTTAIGRATFQ